MECMNNKTIYQINATRSNAIRNNEKPASRFTSKDVKALKIFLTKNKFCTEEDLKELTVNRLTVFLKMIGKSSLQYSQHYHHLTDYYNVPFALTGKYYFYRDIKKRSEVKTDVIDKLLDICNGDLYRRPNKRCTNEKNIAIVRYMENGEEKYSYGRIYSSRVVFVEYDENNHTFKSNKKHKNLSNVEIVEYVC